MRRRALKIGLIVAAAAPLLALLTFALPISTWRTGERAAAPLPLVNGGPLVAMPRRVWIDTDAACGHAANADADDCFALLILLRAPGMEVAGISVVGGNAPAEVAERIVRELVARLALAAPSAIHAPPRAEAALAAALERGPLTVVALGPLTNIAATLRVRPDLGRNVARLVAVMGRRPGHLFHPAEGRGNGILFGHGPIFRDFNFALDRGAARDIVAMNLPLTLVPYEGARNVVLTGADLARLEKAGGAPAWVAQRARGWLGFWSETVGLDGFYPFDALAAASVLEPRRFDCAASAIWVDRDRTLWGGYFAPEALLVGRESDRPAEPRAGATAIYCPRPAPGMHDWLMARLSGG